MYLYPLARVEKIIPYDKDNYVFYFAGSIAGFSKCVFTTNKPDSEIGKYQC